MWTALVNKIDGLNLMLIWWCRFSRDFAYREIGIFVALFSLHVETPIPETLMKPPVYTWMVPISAWFNDCDHIAKSHIAISEFLMSSGLDIINSRSPNLRWLISFATSADLTVVGLSGNLNGIQRSLDLPAWFNGCDQFAKSCIGISGFSLSSELCILKSWSPKLRWLISLATSANLTVVSLSGNLNGIQWSLDLCLPSSL